MAAKKPIRAKRSAEKKIAGFTVKEIKLLILTLVIIVVGMCAIFFIPKWVKDSANAKVLKNAPENMILCNVGTFSDKEYREMARVEAAPGYALTNREGSIADPEIAQLIFTAEDAAATIPGYAVRSCKNTANELIKTVSETYSQTLSDILSQSEIMSETVNGNTVYSYFIRYRYEDSSSEEMAGKSFHEIAVMYVDIGFDAKQCVGVMLEKHCESEDGFAEDEEIISLLHAIAEGIMPVAEKA